MSSPAQLDPARVPAQVLEVLRTLRERGFQAWLAGGGVRDLLLGRPVADWDVASDARPPAVQQAFPRTAPTGIEHGTVTVLLPDGGKVEVTTFRGEGPYLDGRRPSSVTFLAEVEADLARRDFTVNAMAWDPLSGALRDPFGGREDLARRRIRAVGDPRTRFGEDGLRPLRAVRFASVLGFVIEPATRRAIPAAREVYEQVAVERVRDELTRILLGPHPGRGLDLMRILGLLDTHLGELAEGVRFRQNRWHRWDVWRHTLRAVDAARPELVVRLAALLHDVAKPRCAAESAPGEHTFYDHEFVGADLAQRIVLRLRYPREVAERVALLVREHNWYYKPEWNDATVRRYVARIGEANLGPLFALREADLLARGRAVREGLENLAAARARFESEVAAAHALRISDLAIGGAEVMEELGRGPGPWVGQVLRTLLDRVLEDPSQNDPERLRAAVRALRVESL